MDVTEISDVKLYDKVTLIGKNGELYFGADDMVQILGTIGYEIVVMLGKGFSECILTNFVLVVCKDRRQ